MGSRCRTRPCRDAGQAATEYFLIACVIAVIVSGLWAMAGGIRTSGWLDTASKTQTHAGARGLLDVLLY